MMIRNKKLLKNFPESLSKKYCHCEEPKATSQSPSIYPTHLIKLLLLSILIPSISLAAPRLEIGDPVYDFGNIDEGNEVNAIFALKNTGDSKLEIKRVYPACGCTVADLEKKILEPNEATSFNVVFDTSGFFGYKVKTIRIYSNDPRQSSAVITLKGNIRRDVEINPSRLYFGLSKQGQEKTMQTQITLSPNKKVQIKEITSRSKHVEVKIKNTEGGKIVTAKLKDDIPVGIFRNRIYVKTTSKENPVLNIPVFARIEGDLELSPTDVSFGLIEGPIKNQISKKVIIQNTSNEPIEIKKVRGKNPLIQSKLKTIEKGKKYEVTVSLAKEASGTVRDRLRLETTHKDKGQKTITLPVYAIVSRESTG